MKLKLHWQVAIALLTAALLGILIQKGLLPGQHIIPICEFIGKKLFLNALKMLVVPLIVPSIICGVMNLGTQKNFGRLGLKTFTYYALSGFLAILTGLLMVNLIKPGAVDETTRAAMMAQQHDSTELISKVAGRDTSDLVEILVRMIPQNVLHSASDNTQLLGVIFFSILFGFFISRLPDDLRKTQQDFWRSAMHVMTLLADFIIKFAPIGVLGLVTPVIATTGAGAIKPLLAFFITVAGSLSIHAFITLPLLLLLFKVNPHRHFRATSPALLTAFSTASSAATLPVTMESVEKRAGISNRIASFTLPLGATVNMDGTALYECVVVMFVAQFAGIVMGLEQQFMIVLLALLTSVGVAGIPKASLTAIVLILTALELPMEAIGIVMVVDRILDMCRTSVNVFSDTCGAAIIASSEGEKLYQK